jgi:hypothetical protein
MYSRRGIPDAIFWAIKCCCLVKSGKVGYAYSGAEFGAEVCGRIVKEKSIAADEGDHAVCIDHAGAGIKKCVQ